MSPTKATKPGERQLTILGVKCVVDFNDRDLLRDTLALYEQLQGLSTKAEGPGSMDTSAQTLELVNISLDIVDEADRIVSKAVGAEIKAKLWSGSPIMEPIQAFLELVGPAGNAYDELFADFVPK